MKRLLAALVTFLLAQITYAATPPLREWRLDAKDPKFESYLGRDSLLINGSAWFDAANFRDGVISFDVAASAVPGFHGVAFRAVDDNNFEHFYLRYHHSGDPDATQYQPVYNNVTSWQIYSGPRYSQAVNIAPDRWVHVELRIKGSRMEALIDGQRLVFPDLVRPAVAGAVALVAGGPNPARYTNVEVRPGDIPDIDITGVAPATPAPKGSVMRWRVSTPFAESRVAGVARADAKDLKWDDLDSTPNGIANIATARKLSKEQDTVFAATTINVAKTTDLRVQFAFSERVVVFIDGRPIYRGLDNYRSRDYRFLGTVGMWDEVILHLDRGEHQLWFAVSEDFGGWAIGAAITP
jgi:hypothetical protein